jgi:ubiquinone biosynthesis monooxygenase Coq7
MAGEEKEHLDYFNELAKKESIKPTKLSNLFGVGAFAMGIGTALLGRKAAYVCTEAVEEVIEAHYQKQIDELEGIHDDVREKIIKFQEDEVEHKNTAINQGSQQTFGYSILRKTINETTKLAIFMAERY